MSATADAGGEGQAALRMRNPVPGPQGGGFFVSELQRARLLDAVFAVVAEQGYRGMAVRAVTERAGISSKTFYDLFTDREDCFLAAFDHGVDGLAGIVGPAYAAQREWVAGLRAGLGALLEFLDREPALRTLVFVEALGAGPRVLTRRAQVLQALAGVIDGGRAGMEGAGELPRLTAESVVGATVAVIHARLLEQDSEPLTGLLNELMATIVLPYRGRAAATGELARPTAPSAGRGAGRSGIKEAAHPARRAGRSQTNGQARDRLSPNEEDADPIEDRPAQLIGILRPVDFRMTLRTQTVLAVVAEHPGLSNQRVSDLAGIADQGQISRLMMRLAEQGLVENIRGGGQGAAKAWRLTPEGGTVIQATATLTTQAERPLTTQAERPLTTHAERPLTTHAERPLTTHAERPLTTQAERADPSSSGRSGAGRSKGGSDAPPVVALRLTALTYKVLAATGELAGDGPGAGNREIADAAGVRAKGQMSKMLARLESHCLLVNAGGQAPGIPNAWRLTAKGREIVSLSPDRGRVRSEDAR